MAKQQQYPPMQYGRSRNPFGELTHSGYVPTYVGLPIDRMKETADVLQDNYNTAIANKNKTETMLAQMNIDPEDEKNRTEALMGFEQELAGYKEKGNWEDAQIAVANSTKNIAVNSGLIQSLKSKKQKDVQLAAQKANLASGKILPVDAKYREKQANSLYSEQGGVYFDEELQAWTNLWNMEPIPEVQNIGEKANKFLTNYKADTFLGLTDDEGYMKKINPQTGEEKWVKAKRNYSKDLGAYQYTFTTEEVALDEVSIAAHKQMLQDPKIDSRLNFTYERDGLSLENIAASRGESPEDAEEAMKIELVNNFGMDPSIVANLSPEDTSLLHYKNLEISKSIQASSMKASYEKQTSQSSGLNLAEIKRRERVKNEGSEAAVVVKQTITAFRSGAMKTADGLTSVDKYIEVQKQANDLVAAHQQTIDNIKLEMQKALKADPNTDLTGYRQQLGSIEIQKEIALYDVKQNAKIYNEAVRNAEIIKGAPVETSTADIIELNKNTTAEVIDEVQLYKDKLYELWNAKYGKERNGNSFEEDWRYAVGVLSGQMQGSSVLDSIGEEFSLDAYNQFGQLFANYTPEQIRINKAFEELKALEVNLRYAPGSIQNRNKNTKRIDPNSKEYKDWTAKREYTKTLSKIQQNEKNDDKLISAELKKQWDNKSLSVPILDLSTVDKSGADPESTFNKRGTYIIQQNPGAFGVYNGITGEKEDWDTSKGSGVLSGGLNIDFNKLTLIGPTMDYIFGVGYGYKAVETTYNEPFKPSSGVKSKKEVIIYEKEGTNQLSNLTLDYLKKGELMEDIGGGKFALKGVGLKGYDQVNDYAAKRVHEQVEKQLAWFQKFPPVYDATKGSTNKEVVDVSLTPDRKAKVTRILQPNNSVAYEIEVFEYDQASGNKGNVIWNRKKQGGYKDLFDVENVLEHFAGFSTNYEVPLGSLERITAADLQYADISNSVTSSSSSAPFLTAPMRSTLIELLETHGKAMTGGAGNMVIHSLTRSIGYNVSIGGSSSSGHLRGEGVDINSTRGAGPNVLKWLENNSEDIPNSNYKRIKGFPDLKWWNHTVNPDGKTGMHIDLKWAD